MCTHIIIISTISFYCDKNIEIQKKWMSTSLLGVIVINPNNKTFYLPFLQKNLIARAPKRVKCKNAKHQTWWQDPGDLIYTHQVEYVQRKRNWNTGRIYPQITIGYNIIFLVIIGLTTSMVRLRSWLPFISISCDKLKVSINNQRWQYLFAFRTEKFIDLAISHHDLLIRQWSWSQVACVNCGRPYKFD